jgi:hypothetical protein
VKKQNDDNKGWVKIHRRIKDHWIWDDPVYFKAWVAILMQVNYDDTKVIIKKKLIECKRGQSLLSLDSWSKVVGKKWTKKKIRHFFKLLGTDKMIITENMDRITTRLTVCNYDNYQNSGHTQGTTQGTHRVPKQELKELKEGDFKIKLKKPFTDETR